MFLKQGFATLALSFTLQCEWYHDSQVHIQHKTLEIITIPLNHKIQSTRNLAKGITIWTQRRLHWGALVNTQEDLKCRRFATMHIKMECNRYDISSMQSQHPRFLCNCLSSELHKAAKTLFDRKWQEGLPIQGDSWQCRKKGHHSCPTKTSQNSYK